MARREELIQQLLNGTLNASKLVIDDLDRRKALYKDVGWLYVLRNPVFKQGLLKVGKTSRFPTERTEELGRTTGLPEGFQLLHYIHVSDHHQAEQRAHQLLASKRYRYDREFFEVSLAEVARVFDRVAEAFPLVVKAGRTHHALPQDYGDTEVVWCRACGAENRVRNLPVNIRFRCSECGSILQ